MHLASFVSPHGFGHAARTSAILRACAENNPDFQVQIFTRVPRWFFDESIEGLFDYHETHCDVGFVQRSALEFDFPGTLQALTAFIPFERRLIADLAGRIVRAGCSAVLCDISPLGIAVAHAARLPSILIENFTWDWLYEPLQAEFPAIERYRALLRQTFAGATHHIQTLPICVPSERAHLVSPPVARSPRRKRAEVRRQLGVQSDQRMILITMGGVRQPMPFLSQLKKLSHVTFLITGSVQDHWHDNLIQIAQDTRVYVPDLLHAADAVIAKLGYGTVAEVWTLGKPMAYVARNFRESASLKDFVDREIPSFEITADSFHRGDWIDRIGELLSLAAPEGERRSGAAAIADYIGRVLAGHVAR